MNVVPARAQDSYAHVCFDMNQVCHQAARRASDLQSVAKLIFREIDATLKATTPTKSIYFAIDGPAPIAKMLTQRKRRSKEATKAPKSVPKRSRRDGARTAAASAISELDDERNGTSSKRRRRGNTAAVPAVHAIDRVRLTPGIDLMHDIAAAVEYYAYVRLQSNPRFQHLDIRISGPDVPGEGELKIFDFLNTKVAAESPVQPAHESAIIIGSDADIVLQALATTSMQNLFVFIRNSHANKVEWAKRTNTIISVWQIACKLHKLFPSDSLTVRLDLIVMSICSGNDYVPKLRGVNIPRLWKRYNRLRRGSVIAEAECSGIVYEDDSKDFESPAQKRKRMKKAAARRAAEAAADEASGPPFANETLVDPVRRTFNWPFLCALVDNVGARVSEPTLADLERSRIASANGRRAEANRAGRAAAASAHVNATATTKGTKLGTGTDEGSGEEDDDDIVLYNGNEAGEIALEGVCSSSDGESDDRDESLNETTSEGEEDEYDEYEDEDTAHLETLIQISGSAGKYFDTVAWLRTLLFTLQMYIDGFCPDYYFAYTKRFAPSSRVLATFIRDADGDPHPVEAPVSSLAPLTPLKAAFAIIPRASVQFLPQAYQAIARDNAVMAKIFPSDDSVCFEALHRALDAVPASALTVDEQKRINYGQVLHLCRATYLTPMTLAGKLEAPKRPGANFADPPREPSVLIRLFLPTNSPPCLPWPKGHIPGMLGRPTRQSHGRGRAGSVSGRSRGSRGGYQTQGRGGTSSTGRITTRDGAGRGRFTASRGAGGAAGSDRPTRGSGRGGRGGRGGESTRGFQSR